MQTFKRLVLFYLFAYFLQFVNIKTYYILFLSYICSNKTM